MSADEADAYMDRLPPARSRYSAQQELEFRARLEKATARRCTVAWVGRDGRPGEARTGMVPLKPTAFVPIADAAVLLRDREGSDAVTRFWDRLALSILDGEFDGAVRMHVVDNQPVIRMRFLSKHMRKLTAHQYSYKDVVDRRLARLWLPRRAAVEWCRRNEFPAPDRWLVVQATRASKKGRGPTTRLVCEGALRTLFPEDPANKGMTREALRGAVAEHLGVKPEAISMSTLDRAREDAWRGSI